MKYQDKTKNRLCAGRCHACGDDLSRRAQCASGQEDGFVIKGTTLQGYVGAENAVVIPDNITKIDDDVFLNTTITSVEIPDSVTTIGDNAFAGCEYLTEVTVPDSVTKIRETMCSTGCTSLESATWESREGIGDGTFAECAGLTDLSISKELPSIGKKHLKIASPSRAS